MAEVVVGFLEKGTQHISGLSQDCSISSALAMEILQSYSKTSIYRYAYLDYYLGLVDQNLYLIYASAQSHSSIPSM